MASSFCIEPDRIYDEGSIALAMDLPLATLARARREGRLRFARKGRRVFFFGQWVIDWIKESGQEWAGHPAAAEEVARA